MILSSQSILKHKPICPCLPRTLHDLTGLTYGVGPSSYDIRIAQNIKINRREFCLASSIEEFNMPDWFSCTVHDKSSWARQGLFVQNTFVDCGFKGYLTLEITNHGPKDIVLVAGTPIAQLVFHVLDEPSSHPYEGRYNNQKTGPQPAIVNDYQPTIKDLFDI